MITESYYEEAECKCGLVKNSQGSFCCLACKSEVWIEWPARYKGDPRPPKPWGLLLYSMFLIIFWEWSAAKDHQEIKEAWQQLSIASDSSTVE